jgi:Flp pilus assembly protein TadD
MTRPPDEPGGQATAPYAPSSRPAADSNETRSSLKRALQTDPNDACALHALGILEYEAGEVTPAGLHLARAVRAQPDLLPAWIALGKTRMRAGQWSAAIESFCRSLELDPANAEACTLLAEALTRRRDPAGAEEALRKSIAIAPDYAPARSAYGSLLAAQARHDEAALQFERAAILLSADPAPYRSLAECRLAAGRFAEARAAVGSALQREPNAAASLTLLAGILEREGRIREAVTQYEIAARIAGVRDAFVRLAVARLAECDVEEATRALRDSGGYDKQETAGFLVLGREALQRDAVDEALAAYVQAAASDPADPESFSRLGFILSSAGRLDEAENAFRHAVALWPDCPELNANLAAILIRTHRPEECVQFCLAALALQPDYPVALRNIVPALTTLRRDDEALDAANRLVSLCPDSAEAHTTLGCTLTLLCDFDGAKSAFERALAIDPESVEALLNLGVLYCNYLLLDEALRCFQRALRCSPCRTGNPTLPTPGDEPGAFFQLAPMNIGMIELRRGNLVDGFRDFEHRPLSGGYSKPTFGVPRWDGRPVPGKTLLVTAEQGLGDQIQFVRFLAEAKERSGARVMLQCLPELVGLFRGIAGCDEVVAVDPRRNERDRLLDEPAGCFEPEYDLYVPMLSLPHVLGTAAEEEIPAAVPYLSVDPATKAKWAERIAGYPGLKVGIRWAGRPEHPGDRRRSCRLDQLAPLAALEGVTLISMQKDRLSDADAAAMSRLGIVDVADRLTDFTETAALIANLDVVVSTCTSVAHLAGALGARLMIALGWYADWRWMLDRDDTPWYPTARLFRQPALGDWASVYERIAAELCKLRRSSSQ